MTKAKKIIIRTQSRELFIVRQAPESSRIGGFCVICAQETALLSFDEAVSRSKTGARSLLRLIENETVHSIETATGHLLICAMSLLKICKERK